jgi:hypothetical protein
VVRDFDPDALLNKVVRKFPQGVVNAIAKARDTGHQIRTGERTNLIATPAQANLIFLKYPAPIRALSHDSLLSRFGAASTYGIDNKT